MAFLSGYRVLDLTDQRGMIAGRMLADLGADVVMVERPAGSEARGCAPLSPNGSGSLFFDAYAANKRGITADLDTEEGRQLVRGLAANVDVVIESAEPGRMAGWQLDYPDLAAVNAALIYVSITAFGRTGPKADYAESDLIVWAAGGPLDPHRDGERPPVRISLPQAYLQAGTDAAGGALFALLQRARSGRGQHVDVSAQASLGVATLGRVLADVAGDDHPDWEQPARKRVDQSGSGSGTAPAQKKWPCRDGTVEYHIGVGPAAGGFTASFMRWMVDEGAGDKDLLEIDWRTVPQQMAAGIFTEDRMKEIRATVGRFLSERTKEEILRAATQRKLLCVPIYDTQDVASSDQLAARNFFVHVGAGERRRRLPGAFATVSADAFAIVRSAPLIGEHTEAVLAEWARPAVADGAGQSVADGGEKKSPQAPLGAGEESGPLTALRVLDLTWVVAGPLIGRALADFGATVIRVESSTRVETARHMPPFYGGVTGAENSALYMTCNAGKLGVTVDLQSEDGRAIVGKLAAWSDVVIESFSPGLMARWGLDYGTLSAGRDDLIMLSTSIMGQSGPFSRLAGYGNVGAALSGFQDIVGWPDRPALGPFGPYTDYVGPRFALTTLLAALDARRRTGKGCYIDVSQVEAGVYLQSPEMADNDLSGTVVHRAGNADREFAPHGVYPCRAEGGTDRFVAIAVRNDAEWKALAQAIRRPDLALDPDLASARGRQTRGGDLGAVISAWTATQFAHDVEQTLQAAGVPAHVSASSKDFCADAQLAHRGHLVTVAHPLHGSVVVEGPRYLLSETPGRVRRAAPTFGQDNEHVLTEILGYTAEQFADLTDRGVLR